MNYKQQFKHFLIQHGAFDAYQIETKRNFDDIGFLDGDSPTTYLIAKLTWARTINGQEYWKRIHDLWMGEIR